MKEITLFKQTYRYGLRDVMLLVFFFADINMATKLYFVKSASNTLIIITFMVLYTICIFLILTFVGSKRTVTYNQEKKQVVVRNSNKDRINGRINKCYIRDIVALKVLTVAEYLEQYRQDLTYDIEADEANEQNIYIGILELENRKSIVLIEDEKNLVIVRMNKIKKQFKIS